MCGHSSGGWAPQSWGRSLRSPRGRVEGGWLHPLIKGERSSIFMPGQQGRETLLRMAERLELGFFLIRFKIPVLLSSSFLRASKENADSTVSINNKGEEHMCLLIQMGPS